VEVAVAVAEAVRVAEAVQLAEVEEVGMAVVEAVVVEAELEPEAVMEAKLVAEGVFMRALGLPVATRVMVMEEEMVGVGAEEIKAQHTRQSVPRDAARCHTNAPRTMLMTGVQNVWYACPLL
jgi:hypothetical protein